MSAINRIVSRATRSRKAGNAPDGSLVKDDLVQLYFPKDRTTGSTWNPDKTTFYHMYQGHKVQTD